MWYVIHVVVYETSCCLIYEVFVVLFMLVYLE